MPTMASKHTDPSCKKRKLLRGHEFVRLRQDKLPDLMFVFCGYPISTPPINWGMISIASESETFPFSITMQHYIKGGMHTRHVSRCTLYLGDYVSNVCLGYTIYRQMRPKRTARSKQTPAYVGVQTPVKGSSARARWSQAGACIPN